ncbi:hypothetical protein DXG03_002814 [Asterophora parasitica]|uniref:Uncharacterized protein n=1 Tax=Asterophora parasitica TaxID=117018 RepID=A0A9P7G829_9AGAR|nr:hypothetical protein DXG03_002814 [Asterophora parasitica]
MNQPVRNYPLRVVNEAAIFIAGEKRGQKVYPAPGAGPMPSVAPPMQPGMPMNFNQQQAMVAQQNSSMEMLERRREQERARQRSGSNNEIDTISTRTLALNRYKRNHDIMNEVFKFAAYGDKNAPPPPRPYSIFNKSEIEEKTARLQEEIEALKPTNAERHAVRSQRERENLGGDPIDIGADGITA